MSNIFEVSEFLNEYKSALENKCGYINHLASSAATSENASHLYSKGYGVKEKLRRLEGAVEYVNVLWQKELEEK